MQYCGQVLIQYIPKNNLGQSGNITYIYAYLPCLGACNPPNLCNVVQNGGFESLGPGNTGTLCAGVNSNSRLNSSNLKDQTVLNNWSVDLFPNPSSGIVNLVSTYEKESLKIVITDVSGKIVFVKQTITSNFICKLDLKLQQGIYFVTIINESSNTQTKKLVIE